MEVIHSAYFVATVSRVICILHLANFPLEVCLEKSTWNNPVVRFLIVLRYCDHVLGVGKVIPPCDTTLLIGGIVVMVHTVGLV